MWTEIALVCKEYAGDGLAVGLFIVSFFYLLFAEKEKYKKIVLIIVSAVILILFLCPLFMKLVYRALDQEVYYRILWLIPMSVIIAYAGIHLIRGISKRWVKGVLMVAWVMAILLTGDYVYDNPYFSVATNRFHVPQTVADVCDAIIIEGREVRAVVPSEMLPYVRQYTANVCMPYGRSIMVDTWIEQNELYDAMLERPVVSERVADLARQQGCHYIVLHEKTERTGDFKACGWELKDTVDGYEIWTVGVQ